MRLAVLTTGRQDWGIVSSTCRLLARDARFDLVVLAGGMHCSKLFGATRSAIEEDGVDVTEALAWIPDEAPVPSATEQAGAALRLVGAALSRRAVDALLLTGDRFETGAAALAATIECVPIVHLHGGEETEGAIDNAIRHAITKMSHLHLVSHAAYADRIARMGEDPAAVHVVGAPGLDNLHREGLATTAELEASLGIALRRPVVVVTLHPATLGDHALEVREVAAAMDAMDATYVITLPNSDSGNVETRRALLAASAKPGRVAVEALGARRYWGLMRIADAMLGNSSSALIEAPVVALPAVNVGDRQKGRLRGDSVIDVPAERAAIAAALSRAVSPQHRRSLSPTSPLGDGHSAEKIRDVLLRWTPPKQPRKRSMP